MEDLNQPDSGGEGFRQSDYPLGDLNIDKLVGAITPNTDIDTQKLTQDVASATRERSDRVGAASDAMIGGMKRDAAMVREKFNGIGPASEIKEWNADDERAKRIRTHLEDFGSLGAIFAVMASAFTRTPMDNALNGAAAAMNAARSADEKAYDAAYDSFKKNMDLVVKRHELQRQSFNDAITLMKTNMGVGEAQMKATAAKYDDKITLAYLNNGYLKEAIDLQEKRAKSAQDLIKVIPQLQAMDMERRLYNLDPDSQSDDPMKKMLALRRVRDKNFTPEQEALYKFRTEHPDATPEQYRDYKDLIGDDDDKRLMAQFRKDFAAENDGKTPSADDTLEFLRKKQMATAKVKDAAIAARVEELMENDGLSLPDATNKAQAERKAALELAKPQNAALKSATDSLMGTINPDTNKEYSLDEAYNEALKRRKAATTTVKPGDAALNARVDVLMKTVNPQTGENYTRDEAYNKAAQERRDATSNPRMRAIEDTVRQAEREELEKHPEYNGTLPASERTRIRQEVEKKAETASNANKQAIRTAYLREWRDKNPGQEPTAEVMIQANRKAHDVGISGNRRDDLESRRNRINYALDTIGEMEKIMRRHNMVTGLGGKVTRPTEIVGNIFGSNQTDRKQFERYVAELKEFTPRIMSDSGARPLAGDRSHIDKIVAGDALGDTTANTVRAYFEFRKFLNRMKGDIDTRINDGVSVAPLPATETVKPRWSDMPVVER